MDLLKTLDLQEIKWLILLITIALSVMDFYIRRIPNTINVGVFSLLFLIGLLINERESVLMLKEVGLVTVASYVLFFLGALGGGDCKYLIAISPILPIMVMFKVLLLAMTLFVISYLFKKGLDIFVKKQQLSFKWGQFHQMPFIWSLIPGVYLFGLCA